MKYYLNSIHFKNRGKIVFFEKNCKIMIGKIMLNYDKIVKS
jgi:hypothetical protein